MVKAIIVDDEKLDRQLLSTLVKNYCSSIHVLDEADSIEAAQKLIHKLKPDVVFLDIQVGTHSGFDLLDHFPERKFLTVFTTGHDEFGVRAVKARAFDYLLKPLDVEELLQTEDRIVKTVRIAKVQEEHHIKVFHLHEHRLIKTADIVSAEAQGSYVKLYLTDSSEVLICKTIKQLMNEIPDGTLHRIHRSHAINVKHVLSYRAERTGLRLTMKGQLHVAVSRSFRSFVKDILS